MDLTESFKRHMAPPLLDKYAFLEVRNAAAVLRASDADAFDEIVAVLDAFWLTDEDITVPGGNRGTIAQRLDGAFLEWGWFPVRVNTEFRLVGKVKGDPLADPLYESSVSSVGFEVDNMKRRVALDVEWNAKDGNLDRDLSAYRALYDVGLIDVAVIITRDHDSIVALARDDLHDSDAARRLRTTTTTNTNKLRPRLERGDGGGCPVLAVGIARSTWRGSAVVL